MYINYIFLISWKYQKYKKEEYIKKVKFLYVDHSMYHKLQVLYNKNI